MNVSVYHELAFVLLGLSVAMLVTAWFRKRMYLGIVMALYGLAIFNLQVLGLRDPLHPDRAPGCWCGPTGSSGELKEATGDITPGAAARQADPRPRRRRAEPNKRYTPRRSAARRPARPKPRTRSRPAQPAGSRLVWEPFFPR